MSESLLIIFQVIAAIFIISFSTHWLVKKTKNALFVASLLATFILIWTNVGGLSIIEKIGPWIFIRRLLIEFFGYGILLYLSYFWTKSSD